MPSLLQQSATEVRRCVLVPGRFHVEFHDVGVVTGRVKFCEDLSCLRFQLQATAVAGDKLTRTTDRRHAHIVRLYVMR
jgi:hypothetical protein